MTSVPSYRIYIYIYKWVIFILPIPTLVWKTLKGYSRLHKKNSVGKKDKWKKQND